MTNYPQQVTLVEVGPRDGLQNIKQTISTEIKKQFINMLMESGLPVIETTSFVSPKWVPQMADHNELMAQLTKTNHCKFQALVPNEKGMQSALQAELDIVAVFAAASETFSQKNINCSIAESVERFKPVLASAKDNQLKVKAYISCIAGCPYEGEIPATAVRDLAVRLYQAGCDTIMLGDTIGTGTANIIETLINLIATEIPVAQLGVHFHDTYGQALANILMALQCGISLIDAATAGLGGCPYAKGASGNVATEDVLYLLHGLGIETGIDLEKILVAGEFITRQLALSPASRVAYALHTCP